MPIPEHLQPQYRDLLHVVGTMNAGLLASDHEGTILWANPPSLRWLGYSYDEILGKSSVELGVAEHAEALRAEISRREREVLELLVGGDRVVAIAEQLFISDHTVRNHLKSMFRKTGTSSQAELIKFVRTL